MAYLLVLAHRIQRVDKMFLWPGGSNTRQEGSKELGICVSDKIKVVLDDCRVITGGWNAHIYGVDHSKRRRVAATTDGGREHSDDTPCTTPRCEAAAPITPLPAQFQYDFSEGTSRQHAATRPPAIPSPLSSPAPPTAGVYSSPMPPPLRLQGVSSSSHAMSMRNLLVSEDKEQCAPPTYPPRPAPPLASLSAPNILAQPSSIQLPSISILAPLEETPPRYFLSSPPTPHIPPSDQQTLHAYHQHIVRPSSSEPTTSDRSADRRTDNNIQSGFPHRM